MTSELPPAFEKLGDELRDAAARDVEIESRVSERLRRSRPRRWLLIALAAGVAAVAGVAGAELVSDREGPPERGDRLPRTIVPAAEPGTFGAVADPAGGPGWALRVFANPAGLDCVVLGRLRNGRLGTYDGRTFRPFPRDIAGVCESLARTGLLVAVQRRPAPQPRTIVYGLARDRRPVRVTVAGRTRKLRPGASGAFIDVREGALDLRGATATTSSSGRAVRRELG